MKVVITLEDTANGFVNYSSKSSDNGFNDGDLSESSAVMYSALMRVAMQEKLQELGIGMSKPALN